MFCANSQSLSPLDLNEENVTCLSHDSLCALEQLIVELVAQYEHVILTIQIHPHFNIGVSRSSIEQRLHVLQDKLRLARDELFERSMLDPILIKNEVIE